MLFRPARASDMDEICALLATSKLSAAYHYALLTAEPDFQPARIRVAWTGGHIVACARMHPCTLRIGTATVAAGTIDHVRTDPRYWGKGLATSLLAECLSALYLDGVTLAPLLSSRHALFARRGWHALAEQCLEAPVAALAAAAAAVKMPVTVRLFEGHDLDAVMALHEGANAARTGSVVRERDDWLGRLTALDVQGATALVAEWEGEVVGFAWARPRGVCLELLELVLAPWAEDVWPGILHGVAGHFPEAVTLGAVLPGDYRRLVGAALGEKAEASTRTDLMLRTVDPLRLLEGIAPVLSARLRDAGGSAAPVVLRIGPLRGGVVLRITGETVEAAHPRRDDPYTLPEETFLALLLGVETAGAQLYAVPLPDDVRDLLVRVFPPQDWVFWRSDAL